MAILEMKNVSKAFGGSQALSKIDFSVEEGEIHALLGENGAGKSTTLRTISGLMKPKSGKIIYEGNDIAGVPAHKIVGMGLCQVPEGRHVFANMTVLENCTLALKEVLHKKDDEANKIAMQYLEKVGLLNKAESYPNKLSGGQKQRVAIARALCMNPEIMLFDEPTSALDPEMIKEVLEVIKELKNQGMTMIIVTHEMNFAKNISNRIIFIEDGHIIEENNSLEFFNNPKTQRAKLFLDKVLYD